MCRPWESNCTPFTYGGEHKANMLAISQWTRSVKSQIEGHWNVLWGSGLPLTSTARETERHRIATYEINSSTFRHLFAPISGDPLSMRSRKLLSLRQGAGHH